MDFVKRNEANNKPVEASYKAFTDTLQKPHQMDLAEYQHTPISMEQLHQAMQGNFHTLPIAISPRQMSTLMLKTNHLSRNLHFNEIPAHLPRNLTSEIELVQSLNDSLHQRNEDLTRNLEANLVRNLSSELELQQHLASLSEQDLARSMELGYNLSRNDIIQNLRTEINMNHELDLSQHMNRTEERRTQIGQVQCVPDTMLERMGHIDPNITQNHVQNLVRIDQINQRSVNQMGLEDARLENDHLPIPFHIKSEMEDEGYFYDSINHNFVNNINGIQGSINMQEPNQAPTTHQEPQPQLYAYNNHVNINPPLAPIDLYSRPQNFVQNYALSNIRENPQNLVIHKQFDIQSPYEKNLQETKPDTGKIEENENLKPEENKMEFYTEYNPEAFVEKNKSDSSEPNNSLEPMKEDLSMSIKGEYVCYKCNYIFPSKRGLKQHSKSCGDISEQDKVGKFSCPQCPYRCQSPAILKIHERTHTGEKPFSCTFCDYKSGQKNNVAKHILVHMKEKPFRCQYCEYRCAQKNNLVVHERTHTGYKPFACPYCDYRTVQKPNLVKHMYLHTDQKPFSCDMCSYRCVQKTNLTKHKQRHLNEKDGEKSEFQSKPYRPRQKTVKCPQCNYRCVQKSSLDKHIMFKHESSSSVICDETIQNLSVKKEGQVFESEKEDLNLSEKYLAV